MIIRIKFCRSDLALNYHITVCTERTVCITRAVKSAYAWNSRICRNTVDSENCRRGKRVEICSDFKRSVYREPLRVGIIVQNTVVNHRRRKFNSRQSKRSAAQPLISIAARFSRPCNSDFAVKVFIFGYNYAVIFLCFIIGIFGKTQLGY